ncbi:MAG: hypothetical protein IPJ07_10755 [Acidobacteria bacterium]|nr:hypothetical protein [Acidobacteriota bacterium]
MKTLTRRKIFEVDSDQIFKRDLKLKPRRSQYETSLRLTAIFMVLFVLLLSASATMAADPGLAYPPNSEATDTKAGSLLYYNAYTSVPAGDTANTKINVTNTNDQSGVAIHVFFVDGQLLRGGLLHLPDRQSDLFILRIGLRSGLQRLYRNGCS